MARFSSRLFMACILIGFGVFFGVEIAKNGIEQINGPFEPQLEAAVVTENNGQEQAQNAIVQDAGHEQEDTVQLPPLRPVPADKAIHKLANKTEQVLESSLQGGVELIVTLFETIVY